MPEGLCGYAVVRKGLECGFIGEPILQALIRVRVGRINLDSPPVVRFGLRNVALFRVGVAKAPMRTRNVG